MEMVPLAGMALAFLITFTCVLAVTGVILLKPLMRNLGNYLEAKADERRGLRDRSADEWDRLFDNLERFEDRLKAIEDRQDFTERLLSRPRDEGN